MPNAIPATPLETPPATLYGKLLIKAGPTEVPTVLTMTKMYAVTMFPTLVYDPVAEATPPTNDPPNATVGVKTPSLYTVRGTEGEGRVREGVITVVVAVTEVPAVMVVPEEMEVPTETDPPIDCVPPTTEDRITEAVAEEGSGKVTVLGPPGSVIARE